ncbi:MAG: hypothetical protein AAF721_19635 [Myxococcota bacterium]
MNTRLVVTALALLFSANCGEDGREGGDVPGSGLTNPGITATGGLDDGGDDGGDDGNTKLDVAPGGMDGAGEEGGNDCDPLNPNATLTGTVFAPNLEIPISGALVYVSKEAPEGIPDGAYCSECVGVPCDSAYVLTEPDGSFELPATAGTYNLVVTKGQFMHSSEIVIAEGANAISAQDSSLPGRWSPENGEWIPRIAVVHTETDAIHNILGKIGMGDVAGGALVTGSENFDVLDQPTGGTLLDDLDEMRKYHIIFVPCLANQGMGALTQTRIDNIRQYVAEGGKWYVTDWSNEYLYEVFPDYQVMHEDEFFGDPDLNYYDTTGTVLDPELLAWLEALPMPLKDIGGGHPNLLSLPQMDIVDSWSGIDAIPSIIVQDDEGNDVDVGHHPWVEGPCLACTPTDSRPMTISANYGCGRMMFSTYHTDENQHEGLTPQELVLLYIILEIGVCHDVPPPPPPPVG